VLGMAAGRIDLERRLVMIMRDSMPCRLSLRSLVVLGAIALIALPGWSLSQQSREKPGSEKKVEKDSEIQKDEEIQGIYEIEAQLDELKIVTVPGTLIQRYELAAVEDGQPATGKEADRLEKLEKQLEALLKEVKSLRTSKGVWNERSKVKTEDIHQWKSWNADPNVKFENVHLWDKGWNVPPSQAGDRPIILSRATYKMPRAKAEALAAFLRGQLNEQTLETRVEEDAIVITTLPEIQKTIGQFIGLVQGRTFTFESSNQDKPAVK
jgi:hypothetical protein